MKRATKLFLVGASAAAALLTAGAASASLTVFHTYTGTVGLSTAGFGSTTDSGNLTANVPAGSTVIAAFIYSSGYFSPPVATGTLNGSPLSYTQLGNTGGCCNLAASRADVTSIVAPVINGGPGGAYTLPVTETSANVDGEALVVVYSNAALPTSTIGILDGFSLQAGDNSSISFASPLNPSAPGFQAEMRIGDGFSCCGQMSEIDVNGHVMTTVAGNNDDSVDPTLSNGNLITVGSDNDPFTVASIGSPATDYNTDHERYDLRPFISNGDTTIHIHTVNPSGDDNIFLETFQVTGEAVIHGNTVPEPATWAMMILGFFGVGATLRRRQVAPATVA